MPLTRIKLTAIADGGITTAKLSNVLDLSGFDVTLPQGVGGTNWTNPVQTADFTAVSSNGYFVDTSNGTITVTLPVTPGVGDYVSLVDYEGSNSRTNTDSNGYYTNRIQINPNGSKINGSTDYLDIGASRGGVQLVYTGPDVNGQGQGWIVTDAANENTVKALLPSTPKINVGGILNDDGFAYFQNAGNTITVSGSGFMDGVSVVLIDQIVNGATEYIADNIVLVNENQITFEIPSGAVTSGQVAGEDPFSVKIINSNGSFVVQSNALEYAPTPTFAVSPADGANIGTVTNTTNDPNADAFADLATTISANSLDPDDGAVTYAITTLPAELTGLTIDANSGALSGGVPSAFPADDATADYTFTVTASVTSDITSEIRTSTRDFVITLEGNVSAPTITQVSLDNGSTQVNTADLTVASGQTVNLYGTGFKQYNSTNPTIVLVDRDDVTEYAVSNVQWVSSTELTFDTTSQNITDLIASSTTAGDERFGIKVTNPNYSTSGYGKSSQIKQDVFEYIDIGVGDFTPATSTSLGTVEYASGDRDFSSLTTTTISATPSDPNDTVTYAITGTPNIPSGATVSIGESTGILTATFPEGISADSAGNSFVVTATAVGESLDSKSASATYTFDITAASASNSLAYDSNIQNSLMFDGATTYLQSQNTSSTGSTTTWTWSCWVKRSSINVQQTLIEAYWSGTSYDKIEFLSGNTLASTVYSSSNAYSFISTELFRDTSAWYHIVWVWDTTNATSDSRHVIYVNGSLLNKASGTSPTSSLTSDSMNRFTSSRPHVIGYHGYSNSQYSNLYLANIHFIDGQALDPSYFGKTDTDSGVWIPKTFDGTSSTSGQADVNAYYGANGFHLDFSPNSLVYNGTTLTTVKDVAPTNTAGDGHIAENNWTAN